MKKILLTGASGFLGYSICKIFTDEYEIHGIYYRQHFTNNSVNWHRFNLLETKNIEKLVKSIEPDAVLHAAAISNPNFCEEHPALAHHINVYSTITLAEVCTKMNIPMLFTSTDLVFNGNAAPYSEDDFPHPISKYGEQKMAAEEVLISDFSNCLVCRLPLLFGFGPDYTNNFLKDWLDKFSKGDSIKAFTDEYRTPISNFSAAEGLKKIIKWILETDNLDTKLIHLGGSETISRYDMAVLIAKIFEISDAQIIPVIRDEMPMYAARPEDVSLISNLAKKLLNFEAPSLEHQMEFLKLNRY